LCRTAPEFRRQGLDFLLGEHAPAAFRQITEGERTQCHANQAQHAQVEGLEQSAYLSIAALTEHDLEPGILVRGAQATHRFDSQRFGAEHHTTRERSQHGRAR